MAQARPDRTTSGFGDMLRSMLLLLIPVLAFVGYQTWVRDAPEPIAAVDYADAADAARSDAPFDVLAPVTLPAGWRATSVRYTPGERPHWHLGVLTAGEEYLGLEQLVDDVDDAVVAFASGTSEAGSVTIAGQRWQLRTDSAGEEVALVRHEGAVSTVVVGTGGRDLLVRYVETLRS